MNSRRKANMVYRYATSIFLMLMLGWLTVSLPFVYAAQDAHYAKMAATGADTEDGSENPFANTNEEKCNSSNSFSEEYLHDAHTTEHFLTELSSDYKIEHASTYIAFYGELLSPPPDCI